MASKRSDFEMGCRPLFFRKKPDTKAISQKNRSISVGPSALLTVSNRSNERRRNLMRRSNTARAAAAACVICGPAAAQTMAPDDMGHSVGNGKRVLITYENLMAGQALSPSVFFSHNASAPKLFELGKPASFYLMRIAEEGNAGP